MAVGVAAAGAAWGVAAAAVGALGLEGHTCKKALYGLYMAVHGCIWGHMGAYGCIWLYIGVYGHIWLYVIVYGRI